MIDGVRDNYCISGSHVVRWPSGLRRRFKAPVRKGVGSNPTLIIYFFIANMHLFTFSHVNSCSITLTLFIYAILHFTICSDDPFKPHRISPLPSTPHQHVGVRKCIHTPKDNIYVRLHITSHAQQLCMRDNAPRARTYTYAYQ